MIKTIKEKLKKTVIKYYLFSFLMGVLFTSAVLVPFYTQWGKISLFQAQILQSWFMFWLFVLEIPTGAVADYLGRKYSMAAGGLIVTFAALVYGSYPSFKIFLLGEFLFSLSGALISGADEALLYDSLKEAGQEKEAKKIFGRADSFRLLGVFVSAPIGSLIAAKFGLNATMLLSAIPFFLGTLIAWSLKEPRLRPKESESQRYLTIVRKGLAFLKNHPTVKLFAFDAIAVSSAAYFVIWYYQPLLGKVGVPILYFGFFHAFLVLMEIGVSANFERLERIAGSFQSLIKFSALVTALSLALAAIYPNIITIILLLIFGGGFGLTRITLISSHLNKEIPSEQRATILSSISMFRRLSLTILNPAVGAIASQSISWALLTLALIPFLIYFVSPINKLDLS